MGCCASIFDSTPDTPPTIIPDPPINAQIVAVSAALGYFGMSSHYGVWENQRPEKEADKSMWLWFRRLDTGGAIRINLENFIRRDPDNPKQGLILYFAQMQRKPTVQSFHRWTGASTSGFTGFLNDPNTGTQHYHHNDDFYVNHHTHNDPNDTLTGREITSKVTLITKWQSYNSATIMDGNCGRGATHLGGKNILLDLIAVGTTATTYITSRVEVEDRNAEGEVTGKHWETHESKKQTTFVDSVQYRVSVNGALWAQWAIAGDSAPEATMADDVVISTPFFRTVLDGGWFKRTKFACTTNPAIDPAIALLLSHLITTEYSVPEIKKDLVLDIPSRPPQGNPFGHGPSNFNYALPPTNGNFVWQ
jgi:hypothetical protein